MAEALGAFLRLSGGGEPGEQVTSDIAQREVCR